MLGIESPVSKSFTADNLAENGLDKDVLQRGKLLPFSPGVTRAQSYQGTSRARLTGHGRRGGPDDRGETSRTLQTIAAKEAMGPIAFQAQGGLPASKTMEIERIEPLRKMASGLH